MFDRQSDQLVALNKPVKLWHFCKFLVFHCINLQKIEKKILNCDRIFLPMNDFCLHGVSKRLYRSISIQCSLMWFVSNIHIVCYSISSLSQLEELDLSFNKLDTLPEWLGSLSSLRVLGVSECGLSFLPDR